jgi:hypothetical protein
MVVYSTIISAAQHYNQQIKLFKNMYLPPKRWTTISPVGGWSAKSQTRTLALGFDDTLCPFFFFVCDLAKTKFNRSQPGTLDKMEDCSNTALHLEDTPN